MVLLQVQALATGPGHRSQQPHPSPRFPRKLVLVGWCAVLVLHALEIGFLVATTWLYQWLLDDTVALHDFLTNLNISISTRTLGNLTWCFAGVAVLHGIVLLLICRKRLLHRLVGSKANSKSRPPTRISSSKHGSRVQHRKASGRCNKWFHLRASSIVVQIFAINGEYFDQGFLVQECIEVSCQVYQAYCTGFYVATPYINNLLVAMIFLNCLSTPMIHWIVPATNKPLRRFLSVLVSCWLNLVNSSLVPLVIFMPYVRQYDPSLQFFPAELLWDDVWWVRVIRENQQVLVTSYVDFITTWLPHLGILKCLVVSEAILTSHPEALSQPFTMISVAPLAQPTECVGGPTHTQLGRQRTNLCVTKKSMEALGHALLILAGFTVLVIHMAAQSPRQLPGCRLEATPWFGTNHSCAVMNINCYRRGIEGNQLQIDAILNQLNSEALFTLIFTHCPALEIPPSLRNLHHFQVVEIYNSTLVNWHQDSSIRCQDNQELSYVMITRSNLSGIPGALLDSQLPTSLGEINMFEANLTALPGEVELAWRTVVSFGCTSCPLFTQIPTFLPAIQVFLADSSIETIDSRVFGRSELQYLDLSGTPLVFLPEEVHDTIITSATPEPTLDNLQFLGLENTQLNQVPKFIRDWYQLRNARGLWIEHSLYGSPYCTRVIAEEEEAAYQQAACAQDHQLASYPFPIDIIEPQRPL